MPKGCHSRAAGALPGPPALGGWPSLWGSSGSAAASAYYWLWLCLPSVPWPQRRMGRQLPGGGS